MRSLFEAGGRGFRDLSLTHALSVGADTLIAIGLAGTLFFAVPSAEARTNVALYLALTVAPFAIIGPTLGRILDRTPASTRGLLVGAAAGRGVLALALVPLSGTLWSFPAVFGLLVLSRVHIITRNALLPLALDEPWRLVDANARIAWIGVLGAAIAGGAGFGLAFVSPVQAPLALAGVVALGAALAGRRLPAPDGTGVHARTADEPLPVLHLDRSVRMARLATAGVRAFNGFLLLLLAFALHDIDAGLADFGALLGASGIGYAVASRAVPVLSRRVTEEPMVVAALTITAAAAFGAGQWFGQVAAALTAGLAGVAWGTAKLAFDGPLQSQVPAERRRLLPFGDHLLDRLRGGRHRPHRAAAPGHVGPHPDRLRGPRRADRVRRRLARPPGGLRGRCRRCPPRADHGPGYGPSGHDDHQAGEGPDGGRSQPRELP